MLAEIFGASGDALDMGLVVLILGAVVSGQRYIHNRRAHVNKTIAKQEKTTIARFTAVELRVDRLERPGSGVYTAVSGDDS